MSPQTMGDKYKGCASNLFSTVTNWLPPGDQLCFYFLTLSLYHVQKFGGLNSLLTGWVHSVWWSYSLLGKISQSLRLVCQQLLIADAVKQGCFSTWKGEDGIEEQVQCKRCLGAGAPMTWTTAAGPLSQQHLGLHVKEAACSP